MKMIDDKPAFIKEIQRFLMSVTKEGDALIHETGVYDERTKLAVKGFKEANGLTPDSVVDYETFELLYIEHAKSPMKKKRELSKGDRGEDVLELNMLLKGVGNDYSEFTDFPHSDYFSVNTERGVFYMKERFGMEADATADGIFDERLRAEYKHTSDSGAKNNI